MSAPLVRSPDADAGLAELEALLARLDSQSREQRQHHIDICWKAAWGAHNANLMAVRARLAGDSAEACRHRERARWYLALARRHKEQLT